MGSLAKKEEGQKVGDVLLHQRECLKEGGEAPTFARDVNLKKTRKEEPREKKEKAGIGNGGSKRKKRLGGEKDRRAPTPPNHKKFPWGGGRCGGGGSGGFKKVEKKSRRERSTGFWEEGGKREGVTKVGKGDAHGKHAYTNQPRDDLKAQLRLKQKVWGTDQGDAPFWDLLKTKSNAKTARFNVGR